MNISGFIEILDAAHLTSYVNSPFPSRGGLLIIGPPGNLKTSLIKAALHPHPKALLLSDLNINSLMAIRESLVNGRYSTLAFPAFEKLYQRKADTAANIEGSLTLLIEEGFTRASFEEQDAITITARSLVIGAMTSTFYSQRIGRWRESGFKRRFLWVGMQLDHPDLIMEAIRKWELIELAACGRKVPSSTFIKFDVSERESLQLEQLLIGQWDATPYILLKKIFAVLKWKFNGNSKKAMELIQEFGGFLGNKMGSLEI